KARYDTTQLVSIQLARRQLQLDGTILIADGLTGVSGRLRRREAAGQMHIRIADAEVGLRQGHASILQKQLTAEAVDGKSHVGKLRLYLEDVDELDVLAAVYDGAAVHGAELRVRVIE